MCSLEDYPILSLISILIKEHTVEKFNQSSVKTVSANISTTMTTRYRSPKAQAVQSGGEPYFSKRKSNYHETVYL